MINSKLLFIQFYIAQNKMVNKMYIWAPTNSNLKQIMVYLEELR